VGLSRLVAYKKNNVLLTAALALGFLTILNYWWFFDILAPQIPYTGSVRANMGPYFIFPIVALTIAQTLFTAGDMHLVTRGFYPQKHDFQKAYLCGALVVFLYSIFYTFFPSWGAYLYIVGPFLGTSWTDYLVLVAWTAVVILATSVFIRWIYGLRGLIRWPVLLLLSGAMLVMVLALAD
jgi:hypothetical protein